MSKFNFPNLETLKEKIKQNCTVTELFAEIEKSLSFLISKPSDDYTNEEKKFLKDQLCQMISLIITYKHKKSFHELVLKLFLEVNNLIISTKLNSCAIQLLIPFFDINPHNPDIFKVTTERKSNIYDFTIVSINPKITILKPEIPLINEELLKAFFSKSVLNIALSMIKTNDLDIQQISAIMNFFTKIQFFLDERLSLSLCIFFSNYALKLLTVDKYGLDGVNDILIFFDTFMNHLLTIQTNIFELTIEMLRYQTQNQYEALNLFFSIIDSSQVEQSAKIIKKTLISLLQQTTNVEIFLKIYSFFPTLLKKITFTAEELNNFVCQIRKIPNDANACVMRLFQSIQNQIDNPINNILLCLNLISCTDNDPLANLIFAKTVPLFDKKIKLNSNIIKITEKIANFIITDLNSNNSELDLLSLGYFLINSPRNDLIFEYVMKIIEQDNFEIYSTILEQLAKVPSQFEGEKILTTFSQTVIDHLIGRKFTPRISRLSEVVVNWIQNFTSVPENPIMTKLTSIDYFKCPDEIPPIVTAIINRATTRRFIRPLINKIMRDTVPEKHSNWAMNLAFDALHDERRDIERIGEILFQLLYENNKKINVIWMIYQAVIYEADFFSVGKISNNGMTVEALLNDEPFTFTIHPLHSTRRIYTEADKFFQKRFSQFTHFTLYIKNKEILPDQPLSVIPFKFGTDKKLRITAKIGENENGNDYCRLQPIFIEFIQKGERFTALFNLMNSFNSESQILFLILNLIDNEMIKPVLSSPIQQIFKRDYFLPLVDLESFALIPFVLDAARGNKTVYSSAYLSTVIQELNDQNIDQVSLFMACKLVAQCAADSCQFETSLIRKCLLTSKKKVIRQTMAEILTKTDETDKLLSILSSTCELQNRSRSKQYFSLLKAKNIDPLFVEFLVDRVSQFEIDLDGEIDQTLNGVFSIVLNPIESTFEKVFSFLFSPPTVMSPHLPFLHKKKSRRNAFNFILKYDKCIEKVSQILSMVPISSNVRKLNDNFSYYKRGFLSPLDYNTSMLATLYSVQSIRNFVIKTKFNSNILNELSNLFFNMTFTCLPTINIKNYPLLLFQNKNDTILSDLLRMIYYDQGFSSSYYDLFHIKCQPNEKCNFDDKCKKFLEKDKKKIIFFKIEKNGYSKFKFPLFFENYLLTAVTIKSDNNEYSVIYRGREMNNTSDLLNVKDNYLFDIYNRTCWFIIENNEISKYDISDLPERCFGGDKKKQSAILLAYEDKNIDIPKIYITNERREQIDNSNARYWPSVVCNSRGFIDFARELFESNIANNLNFGLDAFFKIAIIDDASLNDWKELLINKVLIDENWSKIFINKFISNKSIIEKVDFSQNGTIILPELFAAAKSNYNLDFQSTSDMISKFDQVTTEKQFGFVCDILTILIDNSQLDLSTYLNLLHLLTKIHNKFETIFTVSDRVLKCFNTIMNCLSFTKSNPALEDLIQPSFLKKWFQIAKKSDAFKSIIASSASKCSPESSAIINEILDTSLTQQAGGLNQPQQPPAMTAVTPSSEDAPTQPKKSKNAKLVKRKNRPTIEQGMDDSQIVDNYDDFEIERETVKNEGEKEKEEFQEEEIKQTPSIESDVNDRAITVNTTTINDNSTSEKTSNVQNDIGSFNHENDLYTIDDQTSIQNNNQNITFTEGENEGEEEEEEEEEASTNNTDVADAEDEGATESNIRLTSSSNDNFLTEVRPVHGLLSSSNDSLATSISNDFLNSSSNENFIANDGFLSDVASGFLDRQNDGLTVKNNSQDFIENNGPTLNENEDNKNNEKDTNDQLPFEFELKTDSPMSDSSMS